MTNLERIFEDRTPGTTYCPACNRPMVSHRMLGKTPVCPGALEWSRELPRWHWGLDGLRSVDHPSVLLRRVPDGLVYGAIATALILLCALLVGSLLLR